MTPYNIDGPKTWVIDHIVPLSTAKNQEDLEKLWHYTNLRPYCSYKNVVEGDRR